MNKKKENIPSLELKTMVYQKENQTSFFTLLGESLKDMISSVFLARQLAVRDIKSQYRQSYFGILWAFITPLVTALVWILLNSSGAVRISDTGLPYPIYVITGTLLWSIITESINSPISSTTSAKSIISKINFPKEALITSGIIKLLFNSSVKVVILILFLLFFGVNFQWTLIFFPFILLGGVFFGTTIGLYITPIGMLYKDVSRFITMGLRFFMYATPVVFSIPESGILKTIMEYNPITPIIMTARDFIVGNDPTYLMYFLIVVAICIPLFFIGLVLYRISIPIIIERLSA